MVVAGCVLAGAIGLQLLSSGAAADHPLTTSLRATLPAKLGVTNGVDQPIAGTEEMKRAVGELLNFDDALFRVYQLPRYRVSVYVAYWRPGKMSPRLVASHVPDACWPANGWQRDMEKEGRQRGFAEICAAAGFQPGQARVFSMGGTPEHLVFWHRVGTEMLAYDTGFVPPWWAWLDELWRGGLNLRKEQLFVRVSSDRPLTEVWNLPELLPLRQALLELGLGGTPAQLAKGSE